jgi:hypothetical protein
MLLYFDGFPDCVLHTMLLYVVLGGFTGVRCVLYFMASLAVMYSSHQLDEQVGGLGTVLLHNACLYTWHLSKAHFGNSYPHVRCRHCQVRPAAGGGPRAWRAGPSLFRDEVLWLFALTWQLGKPAEASHLDKLHSQCAASQVTSAWLQR